MNHNGNIPILGNQPLPRMGTSLSALVRNLDENGTFEAGGGAAQPDGTIALFPARHSVVSAEELVEMIRVVVREEVRRFYDEVEQDMENLGK